MSRRRHGQPLRRRSHLSRPASTPPHSGRLSRTRQQDHLRSHEPKRPPLPLRAPPDGLSVLCRLKHRAGPQPQTGRRRGIPRLACLLDLSPRRPRETPRPGRNSRRRRRGPSDQRLPLEIPDEGANLDGRRCGTQAPRRPHLSRRPRRLSGRGRRDYIRTYRGPGHHADLHYYQRRGLVRRGTRRRRPHGRPNGLYAVPRRRGRAPHASPLLFGTLLLASAVRAETGSEPRLPILPDDETGSARFDELGRDGSRGRQELRLRDLFRRGCGPDPGHCRSPGPGHGPDRPPRLDCYPHEALQQGGGGSSEGGRRRPSETAHGPRPRAADQIRTVVQGPLPPRLRLGRVLSRLRPRIGPLGARRRGLLSCHQPDSSLCRPRQSAHSEATHSRKLTGTPRLGALSGPQ